MPRKQQLTGIKFEVVGKFKDSKAHKLGGIVLKKANFPRMSEQDLAHQVAKDTVHVTASGKIYSVSRVDVDESNYISTLTQWGVPIPQQLQAAD